MRTSLVSLLSIALAGNVCWGQQIEDCKQPPAEKQIRVIPSETDPVEASKQPPAEKQIRVIPSETDPVEASKQPPAEKQIRVIPSDADPGAAIFEAPRGPRVWGSAEYLLWWVRGQNLPPLVTTSPPGTPINA